MAIAFASSASAATPYASHSSITISKPSGVASGDLLLAHLTNYDTLRDFTTPSGWTLLSTGHKSYSTSNLTRSVVFYRVADGSEGASFAFNTSGGSTPYINGAVLRYTGVDTSAPIDVAGAGDANSNSTRSHPAVTTVTANAKLVLFQAGYGAAASATPTGMSSRLTYDTVCNVYDQDVASAGSTGTRTNSQAASDTWVTIMLALKAASGDVSVSPGAGSLALTGYAPSASASASVAPAAQSLVMTGYAPSVSAHATIAPAAGAVALIGYAPGVSADAVASPSVGALTITGFAPVVEASAAAAAAASAIYQFFRTRRRRGR